MHALLLLLVLSLTPGSYSDEGPGVCPNGQWMREAADDGGHLDPNGGRVTSQGDQGCTVDPNG